MRKERNSIKRLRSSIDRFSVSELVTMLFIAIAVTAIAFHLYEAHRPMSVTQIESPVLLEPTIYEVGDIIYGKFEGVIIPNGPFTVFRQLICDHQRLAMVDINLGNSTASVLDGETLTPIVRLSSENVKTGAEIRPDTNCSISFVNTYRKRLPLGGERILEAQYFTETFDIVSK